MSARGFLYITENVRDAFENELDEAFGKGNWNIDGNEYNDLWDERNFPDIMEGNILNEEGNVIGHIKVTNEFVIEDYGYGKFIDVNPVSIKITKEIRNENKNS